MGKCKFQKEWMDRTDSNGCKVAVWAERRGDNDLFCSVCECTFTIVKGFYAIKQHFETPKHQKNFSRVKDANQLLITNVEFDSSIKLYSLKDSAYAAELIWCLKIVAGNVSANFAQDIACVFKAMFPTDGAVPQKFALNPTKVRYLMTDPLGPYFRSIFLKEMGSAYYTLMIDETTNNAGVKELQTAVRFWSEKRNEVVSHHLETFYMGHATAKDIKDNILIALNNANLQISKLLMLGSDGPRVNQKLFMILNEEVKSVREKGLMDIGFCTIHMVHNAFLKGLEELSSDASELIITVYRYFKDWPSRWEDFSEIQEKKNLPNMHFIKHVSSRWLTIEPAARRLLEQWDAVIEYFLKFIPLHQNLLIKTNSYKRILCLLKKKTIKAELKFVCISSSLFTDFTGLYQRQEPLIHVLHEHLKDLVINIMSRSCKKEAIEREESFKESPSENAFEGDFLLPLNLIHEMHLSGEMENLISHLPLSEKQEFILQMRRHYVAAGRYIIKKKVIFSRVFRSFVCLKPDQAKLAMSEKKFQIMAASLPVICDEEKLIDEWKLLQLENMQQDSRIDHYWSKILKTETVHGKLKYPNAAKIIKAALTLSHGNAEIERGFSRSARIMTEDRASMSVRTLNARLNIVDGLKNFDNKPHLVPITNELINSARMAYKSYEDYLIKEKQKSEEVKKKKIEEEKSRVLEEEKRKMLEQKKETIEKLKIQLKTEKETETIKKNATDQLLEEANDRLKEAIRKNNIAGVHVAQTMLEGAMKNNAQCSQKRKAIDSLEKKLVKKRDSMITNFFAKKPRTT